MSGPEQTPPFTVVRVLGKELQPGDYILPTETFSTTPAMSYQISAVYDCGVRVILWFSQPSGVSHGGTLIHNDLNNGTLMEVWPDQEYRVARDNRRDTRIYRD